MWSTLLDTMYVDRADLIMRYLSIRWFDLETEHTLAIVRILRSFLWYAMNELKPAMLSLFSNTINQGIRGSHEQTMEASGITYKQLIAMPKMYIFWFMNQAHEP